MPDIALIAGPYRPPRTRPGRKIWCFWRGDVIVAGVTDALIPWPYSQGCRWRRLPILHGDLCRAVRVESVEAVAHHWGVSRYTVRRWRHQLGTPRFNPGTTAVWCRIAPAKLAHARSCRTLGARK
jgi:hypothetical protein